MFLAVHGAMVRPWMQWIRLEVRGAGAAGGKDCQSMPVSAVTCRVCEKKVLGSPPHHPINCSGFPANSLLGIPIKFQAKNPEVFPAAAWAWKPRFGETRPVGMISVAA